MPEYARALVWFRRDLRDFDPGALYHALKCARQVVCVFVFDRDILDALPVPADRRVEFIHACVTELRHDLQARGGGLVVRHGVARDEIVRLAAELGVDAVFFNHDDDPVALARDAAVETALHALGRAVHHYKDAVIFERGDVLTANGTPYSVFTPYKNAWLRKLTSSHLHAYPVETYAGQLSALSTPVPTLREMGFVATNLRELEFPTGMSGGAQLFGDFLQRIDRYQAARDFPARKGPSYLSAHLRFGTVSIRQRAAAAGRRGGRGARAGRAGRGGRGGDHQSRWH